MTTLTDAEIAQLIVEHNVTAASHSPVEAIFAFARALESRLAVGQPVALADIDFLRGWMTGRGDGSVRAYEHALACLDRLEKSTHPEKQE